jgi:hypothetical protein
MTEICCLSSKLLTLVLPVMAIELTEFSFVALTNGIDMIMAMMPIAILTDKMALFVFI